MTVLQVGMVGGALLLLLTGLYEHQLEEILGAEGTWLRFPLSDLPSFEWCEK